MSLITAVWASKAEWSHEHSDRQLLDAFLTVQTPSWPDTRFVTLDGHWSSLARSDAMNVLETILARDLAYSAPQGDDGTDLDRAKEFLALFGEDALFFTNADPDAFRSLQASNSWSWTPATTSTFDLGVGAVSADHVGIYWAQSED